MSWNECPEISGLSDAPEVMTCSCFWGSRARDIITLAKPFDRNLPHGLHHRLPPTPEPRGQDIWPGGLVEDPDGCRHLEASGRFRRGGPSRQGRAVLNGLMRLAKGSPGLLVGKKALCLLGWALTPLSFSLDEIRSMKDHAKGAWSAF